jgi:cell division protein ZapA (FtsZ GTPase activity inhibitor)
MAKLRIEALGTAFNIAADEEPGYLKELLSRYLAAVEKTKRSTGQKDPLRIAILTGFQFCDELQKLQKKETAEQELRAGEGREAQQLAENIIARIDEVLEYDR